MKREAGVVERRRVMDFLDGVDGDRRLAMPMTIAARVVIVIAVLAMLLAIVGMIPAAALTTDPGAGMQAVESAQQANGDETNVWTVVMWTLVGIGGAAIVLSMLYALKRRVGAFPENPTWVAPITIMPASENATEETFGLEPGHHDDHGSH